MLSIRSVQKNRLKDHPMSTELKCAIHTKVLNAKIRNRRLGICLKD